MISPGRPFDKTLYEERRTRLFQHVTEKIGNDKPYAIVLVAGQEHGVAPVFRQQATFLYFTGCTIPGAVALIRNDGQSTLYIPHHHNHARWVADTIEPSGDMAYSMGFDRIEYAGVADLRTHPLLPGYTTGYSTVIADLQVLDTQGFVLCAPYHRGSTRHAEQWYRLAVLTQAAGLSVEALIPCGDIVSHLRRKKDQREIEKLYHAGKIGMLAHEAAVQAIVPGEPETYIRAAAEFAMHQEGAEAAYGTIVGAGRSSTILHYTTLTGHLRADDLVLVDCGAYKDGYCSDITRTYPAAGAFTGRQAEVYDVVYEAYEAVARAAKPGVYLHNPDEPENSLYHIAAAVIEQHGFGEGIWHGIGHHLGMEVHDDVPSGPLEAHDVITLEPGIYLPNERIGIRLEDDFWIVEDGAVCITQDLPRTRTEIESFMTEIREDYGISLDDVPLDT